MKIIISDLDHADHDAETRVFTAAGLDFTLLQCRTEEDLLAQAADAAIVLNQYAPFSRRVIEALPNLRQVIRYGVGTNTIDLDAADAAGVQVCNVPDYGVQEVSDHALALSLSLLRKISVMDRLTRSVAWDYTAAIPVRRFSGLTVGVIGLGRIGRRFAGQMAALGLNVIGHDPMWDGPAPTDLTLQDLDKVIEGSDLLALFCPLTSETYHLLDAGALARMRPGASLVNTSRGGLIDEAALAEALILGHLSGAALDVTEIEPLPADSPLRGIDSCLVTPHMAWYSEESALELKRKVAEEAVRFIRGEPLRWPVNRPTVRAA
jgi:D-3-phosphoglycerate dehydrogenase